MAVDTTLAELADLRSTLLWMTPFVEDALRRAKEGWPKGRISRLWTDLNDMAATRRAPTSDDKAAIGTKLFLLGELAPATRTLSYAFVRRWQGPYEADPRVHDAVRRWVRSTRFLYAAIGTAALATIGHWAGWW
jgi:hypothetical protein